MVKGFGGTLNYNNKNVFSFSNNVKIKYNGRNEYIENGNNINLEIDKKRKAIFDKLATYMSKDGNSKDLSYQDLSYAAELKNILGIKNIKRDSTAGVITFICDDGVNFSFDFETKAEIVKKPTEPKKPEKDSIITYSLVCGDTLSALAVKYHCTVEDILAVNEEIENASDVQMGQKIKIPTYKEKTWQAYQAKKNKYNEELSKYYDYENKMSIYNGVKHASKEIKKGESYYPNEYSFKLQTDNKGHETGYVVITLREEKTLGEIRTELGIPEGVLTDYNPELKEQRMKEIGETGVFTRDYQKAYYGDEFVIPCRCLNPEKPTFYDIKEFFKNLF